MDREKVMERVKDKEKEFSGLISQEGAAHIVAKDEGVQLLDKEETGELDIGNIVSGMNNVTVTGKIQRIFETREFESDGERGKVANLILADETGTVRTSLWNEEVEELIEEGKIEEGDVIEVQSGYVKEDNRENPELRLGRSGEVLKSERDITVDVDEESTQRSDIEDLDPGDRGEIRGNLVKIFNSGPFFKTCPECGNRVEDECEEHEKSKINLVLTGVLDDGTGNIRVVFFRNQAEKAIGMDTEEVREITDGGDDMGSLLEEVEDVLGKEIVIGGRVKINDFFGRPEFIVNSVDEASPKEEAAAILSSL